MKYAIKDNWHKTDTCSRDRFNMKPIKYLLLTRIMLLAACEKICERTIDCSGRRADYYEIKEFVEVKFSTH